MRPVGHFHLTCRHEVPTSKPVTMRQIKMSIKYNPESRNETRDPNYKYWCYIWSSNRGSNPYSAPVYPRQHHHSSKKTDFGSIPPLFHVNTISTLSNGNQRRQMAPSWRQKMEMLCGTSIFHVNGKHLDSYYISERLSGTDFRGCLPTY